MANLLIITQKVDENDDLLGFFIKWLEEFSKRFSKVFVITLAEGSYTLPPNVFIYSLGKEKKNSKIARIFNFYRFLFRLAPGADGIFAHMSPVFAIAAWPVALIFRKKLILWYLHRSLTWRLKIAALLSDKIATAAKESLTLNSDKILELGHGIDIDSFKTDRSWTDNDSKPLKIISVGRISRIKDYQTMIKAAGALKDRGINFGVKIIGQPIMEKDFNYFELLKSLVAELDLTSRVKFVGMIPYKNIAPYYRKADLLINSTPAGGIDKVVLEAMAAGCLVLTSNAAFRKYLDRYADVLIFEYQNPSDLVQKITELKSLPAAKKQEISNFLFQAVKQNHNLKTIIEKIPKLYT